MSVNASVFPGKVFVYSSSTGASTGKTKDEKESNFHPSLIHSPLKRRILCSRFSLLTCIYFIGNSLSGKRNKTNIILYFFVTPTALQHID